MVKTFFGRRGRRRDKIPIRRHALSVEPEIQIDPESERTPVDEGDVEEGVAIVEEEFGNVVEEERAIMEEEMGNMAEERVANMGEEIGNVAEEERANVVEEEIGNVAEEERAIVVEEISNVAEEEIAIVVEEEIAIVEEEISNVAEEGVANMGEEIGNMAEEERANVVEEEIDNVAEGEKDNHGNQEDEQSGKSGNEEEIVESDSNSSTEGDVCEVDLSAHFEEAACEDQDGNYDSSAEGVESGDDIWDDDYIPDPVVDDDHDEEQEGRQFNYGCGDILALGKTFNNSEEFKFAVLKYSLKTQYDIMFYKSYSDRLGAQCTKHEEEKCLWRVYASFERGRNKLMVKVLIDSHVCVRSGYTKLLKSGSIAKLFEERLRINPKIRSHELVDEIKREYNMIVSLEQCRRAKPILSARRKAGHEAHFARLWDYQEEVRISNEGSTMEIETIPGPVPGGNQ